MVQFNFYRREVNCKIVYYGPGLSGKTTNLEIVHQKTPSTNRGELTSIATETDRTLFFDFMPIDLGTVGGMKTKLRLFTVPGQVFYNSTRKLVLQGADGVIFVADSQADKVEENVESLRNLEENMKEQGVNIRQIPCVIQWNKRDMPTALPVSVLEEKVNYLRVPTYEAVAITGEGVFPTLKKCAAMVLEEVTKQQSGQSGSGSGQTPSSGMPPRAATLPKGPTVPAASALRPAGAGVAVSSSTAPAGRATVGPALRNPGSGIASPTPSGGTMSPGGQKPLFKKFKKFMDEKGQEDG